MSGGWLRSASVRWRRDGKAGKNVQVEISRYFLNKYLCRKISLKRLNSTCKVSSFCHELQSSTSNCLPLL